MANQHHSEVPAIRRQLVGRGCSVTELSPEETAALIREWRRVFASDLPAAHDQYGWHAFSGGYTRALTQDEACAAYDAVDPASAVVLPNDESEVGYSLDRGRPDFEGTMLDVYICPRDFEWTMVFAHEDAGPWFCRREWLVSA